MKKILILFIFLTFISNNALSFIIRDSEIENLIKDIVQPIAKAAKQDSNKLHIYILNDNKLNAFVTPGQKIFIFSGLITETKNSNELEAVIAHEIGHITGKHHFKIYEQIAKSRNITLIGFLLGGAAAALTGNADAFAAISGGAVSAGQSSFLSFSRVQEGSADRAAYKFLNESNKSLCGMISFFEVLQKYQSNFQRNAYTQSHPLTRERISDARNAARNENCDDISISKLNLSIEERYKFMQAKILGFTDPAVVINSIKHNKKFNEDHKNYALSIANYKLFNFNLANKLIDNLIKKYPENPYFYEIKAQMYRENGFLNKSLKNYIIVNKLLPNDPLIQIELAHTLINIDNKKAINKAIKFLNQAKKKEIENDKLWYLLSIAYGRNNEMGKSKYSSAYSSYLKGDDTMALNFITRAKKITKKNTKEWNELENLENKINSKKK